MDNFDQESGQQQYANDSGLNVFQQNIWLYGLSGFRFSNQCLFDNDGFCGTYLCLYCTTPIVYGVTFAFIAGAYSGQNIASAFVASATVFVTMAILGTITKKDLSRIGSYASAALIGLIVAMLANLFLHNPIIDYVFSIIAVIIFTILTAWDAQRMKDIYLQYGDDLSTNGLAVLGALQLYLDFVNLFLQFLDIFGANEDK